MMTKNFLEEYLYKNIPISSALGIRVELISLEKIILTAPLINNINHIKTVFGGSLHSVATLSCWSLLYVNLLKNYENPAEIIISSSEIKYIAPVISDFKAECSIPSSLEWERFIKILQKKGKSRIKLESKIYLGNQILVDYKGLFVAIKTDNKIQVSC